MPKTGNKATKTGTYAFVRYTSGKRSRPPTPNERRIPLKRGETFPPIRSAEKGAVWKKV